MKLAFSTLPCIGWSFAHTLQVCRDSGIQGMEMRLGLNPWSSPDMPPELLQQVKDGLAREHVELTNLGTAVIVRGHDAEALRQLRACSRFARAIGAPALRIMLGNFYDRHSVAPPAPEFEAVVRWLGEACASAQDDGVDIWIETHNEFASGRSLRAVLDAVQAPNLKILWDVIHPLEADETVEETLDHLGADLAHVHIKDGLPLDDRDLTSWRYTRLGDGVVPLAEIVSALQARGYTGYFSLEWESTWRPELRGEGLDGETVIPHFAQFMRRLDAPKAAP